MTDTTTWTEPPRLGVGSIVGESFSLFFKRFGMILTLAFIPTLVIVLVQNWFAPVTDFSNPVAGAPQFSVWGQIVSGIIGMVGMSLVTAIIVRLAYDAKINAPMRPNEYVSSALSVVFPLIVCTLIVSFAAGFALLAFIIPGLWVYAVFCVVAPAIVIERAGFGSLGRSIQLTKEYRWPCLGALIIVGVLSYIPVLIFIIIFGVGIASLGSAYGILLAIINAGVTTIYLSLLSICVALIYARLREIKEGTSVESLAEIFA